MSCSSAPKDQFFEKVINPYLAEVLQHPLTIEMREGLLHIRDVQGPKGREETSSDEDEVPLPQPGDMHVEFKKSSLPDRANKPKIEFIPFRLL